MKRRLFYRIILRIASGIAALLGGICLSNELKTINANIFLGKLLCIYFPITLAITILFLASLRDRIDYFYQDGKLRLLRILDTTYMILIIPFIILYGVINFNSLLYLLLISLLPTLDRFIVSLVNNFKNSRNKFI
ncbi:hypothetical protein [Vallitalea guaymasensis]|uniref:hypothetical protein n=1 Tax=Vallitalea guaymasensis TaxID=1185412 RepID=UPI000DE21481|nr:hypothetical protein [Vallitalea guaymasensis]